VIEHLQAEGPKRAAALCEALGIGPGSLSTLIRPAVRAGLIWRTGRGNAVVYSVPRQTDEPAADEEPPPFNLALWLDGDLTICGVTANDNGTVVLTRDQVEQLRRFLGAT